MLNQQGKGYFIFLLIPKVKDRQDSAKFTNNPFLKEKKNNQC